MGFLGLEVSHLGSGAPRCLQGAERVSGLWEVMCRQDASSPLHGLNFCHLFAKQFAVRGDVREAGVLFIFGFH